MQIIANGSFPVHIITKSYLVLRDVDIIQKISKIYAAVSFTITSSSDSLSLITEPDATLSGIYTGVTLIPILPFARQEGEISKQIRRSI